MEKEKEGTPGRAEWRDIFHKCLLSPDKALYLDAFLMRKGHAKHRHTHTHLMCTCGHTDSWGKTLALTLTCTPPSELPLFCGWRLERATPFSYLCAFNASPLLTHHARWKPTRLYQTYTSLCFSQGKHKSSYRTKMHFLHQGWAGYWSSL